MELSDFPMKKQIVFGQIWKRLVIIVVDLNYYELILVYKSFKHTTIDHLIFSLSLWSVDLEKMLPLSSFCFWLI